MNVKVDRLKRRADRVVAARPCALCDAPLRVSWEKALAPRADRPPAGPCPMCGRPPAPVIPFDWARALRLADQADQVDV